MGRALWCVVVAGKVQAQSLYLSPQYLPPGALYFIYNNNNAPRSRTLLSPIPRTAPERKTIVFRVYCP